jgi:anaerobic selenocysteine-containing dehydrogenase
VAGFSREDLFCVVMDSFLTDTADYADIVLPATTQLEHYDVHKSYGTSTCSRTIPAIAPVGESLPNSEVFRRLAARMGFAEPCFKDSDEDICRTALESDHSACAASEWEAVKDSGLAAPRCARALRSIRGRQLSDPSGKCEFRSALLCCPGHGSAAVLQPARRVGRSATRSSRSAFRSRSSRRPRATS